MYNLLWLFFLQNQEFFTRGIVYNSILLIWYIFKKLQKNNTNKKKIDNIITKFWRTGYQNLFMLKNFMYQSLTKIPWIFMGHFCFPPVLKVNTPCSYYIKHSLGQCSPYLRKILSIQTKDHGTVFTENKRRSALPKQK